MDSILVPFIVENPYTIMLVYGFLRIIAKATPWAIDDEIVQLITKLPVPKKG